MDKFHFFFFFWTRCTLGLFKISIEFNIQPDPIHSYAIKKNADSENYRHIQGDSKLSVQTLREDSAHHKDSELHRNPCPQTSS